MNEHPADAPDYDIPVGDATGDPWRYVCPKCGSHTVIKRMENSIRGPTSSGYYCRGCSTGIAQLYDKQQGQQARP